MCTCGELWRPEGVSDSLDLEWQVVMSHWMWVLGIKLWSSDRVASTLTTESSFQSLSLHLFLFYVCMYICISVHHISSQTYLYVTPWNPGLLPWSSQMETGEKYSRKRDKHLPVEMDSIRNLILQKPAKKPCLWDHNSSNLGNPSIDWTVEDDKGLAF